MIDRMRRHIWIIAALGIVLIAAASWVNFQFAESALKRHSERTLIDQAEEAAFAIVAMRETLQASMLAFAEQRGVRQGLMDRREGNMSEDKYAGFLQALDASCRATLAEFDVRNFSLRDLLGQRMAGTGAENLKIIYPDVMQRIQIEGGQAASDAYSERWIVPIRDAEAFPLAFLFAEVMPSGFGKALYQMNIVRESDLCSLIDSTGKQLWISADSLRLSDVDVQADHFTLGNSVYDSGHADVPGTDWTVYLARTGADVGIEATELGFKSTLAALVASLFLLFATILLSNWLRR